MNRQTLEAVIARKTETLSSGVSILTPSEGLPTNTQAEWLVSLLGQMYVEHGITKKREQLLADIESGRCKLWFALRDGVPIGSAALISQPDGSAEVGRAVSMENGVGGLLMLMAAVEQLSSGNGPVLAEVRVSDNFAGVPSGEATQTICFHHLGMHPQALVPAFNHGIPVRQEQFLFSSTDRMKASEPIMLPDDRATIDLLSATALSLVQNSFVDGVNTRVTSERLTLPGWSIVAMEPFSVIVPDGSGTSLGVALANAENRNAFSLIPLSTKPQNASAIIECLNHCFVPCGFDRNPDIEGFPVLMLGKLRQGTLLAPIKLISDLFGINFVQTVKRIDQEFRIK
jgi:hypothetical protein